MRVVILLLSFSMLYSCEESRTACLDFNASNYDFGAVAACDSCCTYPEFKSGYYFHFDSITYHQDSLYNLNGNDSIKISSFVLSLSDFRFRNTLEDYTIIDTVRFDGVDILDDYLVVRSTKKSGTTLVGHTDYETAFDQILVNIGFNSNINNASAITSFGSDSNLQVALDSLFDDSEMQLYMLKTTFEIADSIRKIELNNNQIKDVVFSVDRNLEAGVDWQIQLSLDLKQLFEGVTKTMSTDEIEILITQNLAASINLE
jgi:hypothetical protein